MGRSPCLDANGLKRGPWTPEEDQKLLAYIQKHGHGSWRSLPEKAGLQRCGKSCRLRWTNYLRPDIKRGKFSLHEEQTIIQLHALLGNRWSAIAAHLPKRTDNEIKNYWNTYIKKRLAMMGIDPMTHRPKVADGSNLSHMAQWESARLEAEARLVKESKAKKKDQQSEAASSSVPASASAKLLNKMSTTTTKPRCLDILKAWESTVSTGGIISFGNCNDLESPTSILQFSGNKQAATMSNNNFGSLENLNKKLGIGSEINEGLFLDAGAGAGAGASATGEAWSIFGSCNVGDENFIEGVYNYNYWNDLINVVECRQPNTSPFYIY